MVNLYLTFTNCYETLPYGVWKSLTFLEILSIFFMPAVHERYPGAKIYSCQFAQQIVHRVRLAFTELFASCNSELEI